MRHRQFPGRNVSRNINSNTNSAENRRQRQIGPYGIKLKGNSRDYVRHMTTVVYSLELVQLNKRQMFKHEIQTRVPGNVTTEATRSLQAG